MWFELSEEELLADLECDTVSVTRYDLLVALLTYALAGISACKEVNELKDAIIRVSHPAWQESLWHRKKWLLENAVNEALQLVRTFTQGMTVTHLHNQLHEIRINRNNDFPQSSVDVAEPTAAALRLFRVHNNSREVCAVIDIGAGTTDVALLSFLTPDADANIDQQFQRQAVLLAKPKSIPYAGDCIDKALMEIIENKIRQLRLNPRSTDEQLREVQLEIRSIKELLFTTGSWTAKQGFRVSINELLETENIKSMQKEISQCFTDTIADAKLELVKLYNVRTNYVRQLNLTFAGGGAHLKFIHECIPSTIDLGAGITLPVEQVRPSRDSVSDEAAMLDARLAVCAGGTTPAADWPINNPDAARFGPTDFGPIPKP
jgi:hypothetical protein